MGFNDAAPPADFLSVFHTVRFGIYGDDNLTSGAVRVLFGYANGSLRDTFSASDGTLAGRLLEMRNFKFTQWDDFPDQVWQISGQKARCTNPVTASCIALKVGNAGIGRTDADVSVDVSDGGGICLRYGSQTQHIGVYLDIPSGRVKAYTMMNSGPDFGLIVRFTGSIPITAGTTYTLRCNVVGNLYSIYVNGVLDGTFTSALLNTNSRFGLHCHGDAAARFDNFNIAKISDPIATNYVIRNYASTIINSGPITGDILDIPDGVLTVDSVSGHRYGWYKGYITGPNRNDGLWNDSYGDFSFGRIKPVAGFPSNVYDSAAILQAGVDEISRGVMSLGIARYAIDNAATAAATTIATMTPIVEKNKTWWVDNADPVRPRRNLIAFPNGTLGNESNVTAIVNGLKPYVQVWEARNEPNFFVSPAQFVTELTAFHTAVKNADPTAIVIGPGTVSFNPGTIDYFDQFLTGGGDAACEAYSVHPYNCYNGDVPMMRKSLGLLTSKIALHGDSSKDIYQTEQGFGHAYAGIYWPHYAARWTALMVFGQEVLTQGRMRYENSFYWYDTAIGFDNFPMFWLTPVGPGPQPFAIRTQAAEVRNKTFTSELNFGPTGNQMYIGGVWTNSTTGDKVIGVIAASYGANDIRFAVTGASTFVRVDSWGNEMTVNATGGYVTFPVSELGCWLRVPNGTTAALDANDWNWGTNLALAGTPFTNSPTNGGSNGLVQGTAGTYVNLPDINDGEQENWYYDGHDPFGDYQPTFPMILGVTLTPQPINRIVVFCEPPWQRYGTMTDFDLQTFDGTTWTTRQTWTVTDQKSFPFAGYDRCTYETFWDDQWVFEHKASSPITNCRGVRVLCRANSYGGFINKTVSDVNNGQSGWGYWLFAREIQTFNVPTVVSNDHPVSSRVTVGVHPRSATSATLATPGIYKFLLENGSAFLLENGSALLLESDAPSTAPRSHARRWRRG